MSPDEDSDIKVADFGLAVVLRHGLEGNRIDESMRMKAATDITEGYCGSPICMAPEVASRNAAYGPQCDIWSVGCITFELLSGNPPFNAPSAPELFQLIHMAPGPSFNDWIWLQISANAKALVTNMLKRYPEDRVSAREALQHQWFHTAPDNHNALAQDNIIRNWSRATRTSFATTATLFGVDSRPSSRRPSRAPSLTSPDALAPRPPRGTTPWPTSSIIDSMSNNTGEEEPRSDFTGVTGVLHLPGEEWMSSGQTSHACISSLQAGLAEEDPKEDVEGKVFQIARGGLQQAAWTEDNARRKTYH